MYYRDNGRKMVGSFTGCAILASRPPQEVEEFTRQYGLSCDRHRGAMVRVPMQAQGAVH